MEAVSAFYVIISESGGKTTQRHLILIYELYEAMEKNKKGLAIL